MIQITLNGQTQSVPNGATVADLLNMKHLTTEGIAVALNAEVLRRASWASTPLQTGDRVDVIRAVQGG